MDEEARQKMTVEETFEALDRLIDYVFHTPEDPLRSPDCVRQRCNLIRKNLEFIRQQNK